MSFGVSLNAFLGMRPYAATLILPILAHAGPGPIQPPGPIPTVPEVNPVWVLIPVAGAVLLFSARKQFPRRKG
jgi:hypothetical protein